MIVVIFASIGITPTAPRAAEPHTCVDDWVMASAIVTREKMPSIAELSRIAGKRFGGQIMSARLCNQGARYFYRLVVKGTDGRVRYHEVKAGAHRE